jgi:DNA mismatch repair protein MutS
MGDFYEMFFEDAIIASRILDIALTSRDKDSGIPMCGIPYHARDSYIVKLLKNGKNVAICEQLEEQEKGGLFKREVVEVLTPGLISREDFLESGKGNFLVAINLSQSFSVSAADISTGELYFEKIGKPDAIVDAIQKIDVAEIIYDGDTASRLKYSGFEKKLPAQVAKRDVQFSDYAGTVKIFSERFSGRIEEDSGFLLLLDYIMRNQPQTISNLLPPKPFILRKGLYLDESALKSLEVLISFQGGKKGSLYGVLDRAKTPMGKRLIKKWLAFPLSDLEEISARLECTEEFAVHHNVRKNISALIEGMCDLERGGIKIVGKKANPRDLIAITHTINRIEEVKKNLVECSASGLKTRGEDLHLLEELRHAVKSALVDDPPPSMRDGGFIREGCDERIDTLRQIKSGGVSFLKELEEEERKRAKIPSLKVKYNKVFGYFIEVSKSYLANVPAEYIRKQTLVNAERYITPQLKEFGNRQLTARGELIKLEEEKYRKLLETLTRWGKPILDNSKIIAEVDVFCSFAQVACENDYVKPKVHAGGHIDIKQGRHPVVEKMVGRKEFVPNDMRLDQDREQIAIITGPNMAGKSTFIRQVALMVLMAHAGSFIPAESGEIALTDAIFTRIGVSDNIHLGESTFMVEMKEVSKILGEVTDKSIIVLDEIGRGTSTYDGLSIAWAVIEYVHSLEGKRPMTLFATHYHEICELGRQLPRANNYNISVKEWNEQILFLRKIEKGSSNKSYGIYVGEIAGLPPEVTKRAKEILKSLEDSEYNGSKTGVLFRNREEEKEQLNLFAKSTELEKFGDHLDNLNLDRTTPIEALNLLEDLREKWNAIKRRR